jgi:hypothetical protein
MSRCRLFPATVWLLLSGSVAALEAKLLTDPTLPDFSYAGYQFGETNWRLPANATALHVADFGARPDDKIDDSAAFIAALKQAHEVRGPVVLKMAAGRYDLSAILPIERSDFTLEGQGMGVSGTELYFPRPLRMVDTGARFAEIERYLMQENKLQIEPARNVRLPFSVYSWTGGFIWIQRAKSRPFAYLSEFESTKPRLKQIERGEPGKRTLVVRDTRGWRVGDAVRIEWRNARGANGPLVNAIYGARRESLVTPVGSRLWEDPKRALVTQLSEIAAVSADGVVLRDPLLHPIDAELPAHLSRFDALRNVALRDFAVRFPRGKSFGHHLEEGYNAIYLSDAIHASIDSIRVIDADSALLSYHSAASTLSNIHTEGERQAHYSVHLGNVHGLLVQDLVVRNSVIHPLSFNTFCTRSVYQRATVWQQGLIDQHAGVNQQNLIDQATFYVRADRDANGDSHYALWDGSGAGYWQPGHGRLNTHWNLRVEVLAGAAPDSVVRLTGLDEGPDARIVGVHGNRPFTVDYRPAPALEGLNRAPSVPSLYAWQLARRLGDSRP